MRAYISCTCEQCKAGKRKHKHKRKAHRMLRRIVKKCLRDNSECPNSVATGYSD